VPEEAAAVTQFVEFARFVPKEGTVGKAPPRVSVNVAHISAVVAHVESGTLLRFVGSGADEHVAEDYTAVMRTLNR
jgi:hypothetical protein